jgi:hypothetical protein
VKIIGNQTFRDFVDHRTSVYMESSPIVFGGKYSVEKRLASGGEGTAYLVRDSEGKHLFVLLIHFLTLQ